MDKIEIKGLEVFAHHGVYEEEQRLGQKFVVSAVLSLDTTAAAQTDDLDKTVNYGASQDRSRRFCSVKTISS